MISLVFPWPSSALSPNARLHWAVKAKAVKQARSDAAVTVLEAGVRKIKADRLIVTAIFAPPNGRRFDSDNLLSRSKAMLDGIADVIGVDDHKWDIAIKRAEPVKGGNVRIEIEVVR